MADLYATPSAAASFVSFLQEKKTSPYLEKAQKSGSAVSRSRYFRSVPYLEEYEPQRLS